MRILKLPFLSDKSDTEYFSFTIAEELANYKLYELPELVDNPDNDTYARISSLTSKDNINELMAHCMSIWVERSLITKVSNFTLEIKYSDGKTVIVDKASAGIKNSSNIEIETGKISYETGWNHIFISKRRIKDDLYIPAVYINGNNVLYKNGESISEDMLEYFDMENNVIFKEAIITSIKINTTKVLTENTRSLFSDLCIYTDNFIATEREVKSCLFTPSLKYRFNTPIERFQSNLSEDVCVPNESLLKSLNIKYDLEVLESKFEGKIIKRLTINPSENLKLNGIIGNYDSVDKDRIESYKTADLFNGKKEERVSFDLLFGRDLKSEDLFTVYLASHIKFNYDEFPNITRIRLVLYDYKHKTIIRIFDTTQSVPSNFDTTEDALFSISTNDIDFNEDLNFVLFAFDASTRDLIDVLNIEFEDYNTINTQIGKNTSGIFTLNGVRENTNYSMAFEFKNILKDLSSQITVYSTTASYYRLRETNAVYNEGIKDGTGVILDENYYSINTPARSHPKLFESRGFRIEFYNSLKTQLFSGWYRPRHMLKVRCYSHALPVITVPTKTDDLTYTAGLLVRNIGYSASSEFNMSGSVKLNSSIIPTTNYLYSKNMEELLNVNIVPLVDGITVDVYLTVVNPQLHSQIKYMRFTCRDALLSGSDDNPSGIVPYEDYVLRSLDILIKQADVIVTFYDSMKNELGDYYLFNNSWKLIGQTVKPSTVNQQYVDKIAISFNDKLNLINEKSYVSIDTCSPVLLNRHTNLPFTSLANNMDSTVSDLSSHDNHGKWNGDITPVYESDGDGCYHWVSNDLIYLKNSKTFQINPFKCMIKMWLKPVPNTNHKQKILEIGRKDSYYVKIYLEGNKTYIEVKYDGKIHVLEPPADFTFEMDKWNLVVINNMTVWINDKFFNAAEKYSSALDTIGWFLDPCDYFYIGLNEEVENKLDYKIADFEIITSHQDIDFEIEDIKFLMESKTDPIFDIHGHMNFDTITEEENIFVFSPYGGVIANSFEENENVLSEDYKIKTNKNIVSANIIER